ncbi:extensin family protein [Ruegeria pomeroyi]|nr:extensin family protein [Ruegeria pomeroyi]
MTGRGHILAALALTLWALPLAANAPARSLRPVPRAVAADPVVQAAIAVATEEAAASVAVTRMRPNLRPPSEQEILAAATPPRPDAPGLDLSPRPELRPKDVEERALFGRKKRMKGAVCGNPDIQGSAAGRVPGKIKGCGIKDAVRVTSVSGVRLSTPAVMECGTAEALNHWVVRSVKPTFRRRGPVVELQVAAHYACRTRNNQRGAKISEHGRGRAIDISAFVMNDGERITVLEGWKRGATRKMLRQVWKEACGPFGTVLGPEADRYHKDHLHLDTARHRGGPYCR